MLYSYITLISVVHKMCLCKRGASDRRPTLFGGYSKPLPDPPESTQKIITGYASIYT